MAKCYNTRLDGVVDNPNLPVLGSVKFTMNSGTWFFAMAAKTDSNCIVEGEDGVSFSTYSGSAYTNPFQLTSSMTGFNVISSANGKKISISDKFNIKTITSGTFAGFGIKGIAQIEGGLNELYVPSDASSIGFENCSFSYSLAELLALIPSSGLRRFTIKYCNSVLGTMADFSSHTALENLTINYCSGITGDISDLNTSVITNMALANSDVSGTIEGFVAKQRTLGRTTGSVSGNSAGWGKVTFNGLKSNAKGTVSWTASTITMNGITITA